MIRRVFVRMCLWAALVSLGCAAKQIPPPDWIFEKDAIHLHFKADKRRNEEIPVPPMLLMCIYQLKEPNRFNQLSGDLQGIYRLLECDQFDDSVASVKHLIINPEQDVDLILNRAVGARYVGLAAGYYLLEKERMIRLVQIPVIIEEEGFFRRTKLLKPKHLQLEVTLGPNQIRLVKKR